MSLNLCATCSAPLPDDASPGALCPGCSQAAGAQTQILRAPTAALEVIGDYEVIAKLGQGGMGAVYRARQVSLGRMVALKVLPQQFGDDAEFITRFQREAKVAAGLNHANLVRVYAAGQADGAHYIAMELIEGENLHQRVKRERLTIAESLRICADVARGLQFGWEKAQLVHRDIKPSNIYLSHGGEVKVGDLGLAKSLTGNTTGLTQSGTMMGTPHYMSPEQCRGDRTLDFRADMYSLGCTLYELLTGQPPYPGSDPIAIARQHLDAPLPAILRALPGCPMPLVRLVGKMLKKQPRERHATYEDLIAEVEWVREQIESGAAVTAPAARAVAAASPTPRPPTQPASTASGVPRRLPVVPIAIAALVVLGLGGWALLPGKKRTVTKNTAVGTSAPKVSSGKSPGVAPRLSSSSERWVNVMTHSNLTRFGTLDGADLVMGDACKRTQIDLSPHVRDGAVRMLFTADVESLKFCNAYVRHTGPRFYAMNLEPNFIHVGVAFIADGQSHSLKSTRLPETAQGHPGQPVEFELRAIGSTLIAKVNGFEVAHLDDPAVADGKLGIRLDPGVRLHAVQILDLKPSAPPRPASTSTTEPWRDMLRDPQIILTSVERVAEGFAFDGASSAKVPGSHRDGAIRFRTTFGGVRVSARCRQQRSGGVFSLAVIQSGLAVSLARLETGLQDLVELKQFPLPQPLQPGQDYDLELRIAGTTLTVRFNGQTLGTATDSTYSEGVFGIGAASKDGPNATVRSVEFLDLDTPKTNTSPSAPTAASIPSAIAAKDAPFENSLGMKFVPMANDSSVLFSIWETRRRDYAVYAAAKPVDSAWKTQMKDGVPISDSGEHPVVGVNWGDATAFCTWLNEKESA